MLPPDPAIKVTKSSSILPLLETLCAEQRIGLTSCIDIGSGTRHKKEWFDSAPFSGEATDYACVEVDPRLQQKLRAENIRLFESVAGVRPERFDLSLALEVIEHIPPEAVSGFMADCAAVTGKIFAATVPNFEYWDEGFKALPKFRDIRWLPDHYPDYRPGSTDPHAHKQAMTPDLMLRLMTDAFDPRHWSISVYRAWPWQLRDLSHESRKATFHFKIFAIAVAHDLIRQPATPAQSTPTA